jgi:transposase
MARKRPRLGQTQVAELEAAWPEHTTAWARQRLMVLELVARHALSAAQIAAAVGVGRSTVFRYLDKFPTGGVAGLLHRDDKGGPTPTLAGDDHAAFVEQLRAGKFRRAKEAQAWIRTRPKTALALSSVCTLPGKLGGVLKVPRKTHAKKYAAQAEAFQTGRGENERGYLHEALEVDGASKVELLFTPAIDRDIHAAFLSQIGESDPAARHVIIRDQAGFPLRARRTRGCPPTCASRPCRPTARNTTLRKNSATS